MASDFAESIKPQVLMITTSQPSMPAQTVCPASWMRYIIRSQSTWFFAQPRDIKPMLAIPILLEIIKI